MAFYDVFGFWSTLLFLLCEGDGCCLPWLFAVRGRWTDIVYCFFLFFELAGGQHGDDICVFVLFFLLLGCLAGWLPTYLWYSLPVMSVKSVGWFGFGTFIVLGGGFFILYFALSGLELGSSVFFWRLVVLFLSVVFRRGFASGETFFWDGLESFGRLIHSIPWYVYRIACFILFYLPTYLPIYYMWTSSLLNEE